MSAPNGEAKEAVFLNYGFLAAKSSDLISDVLEGHHPDAEGTTTLDRAKSFLLDVISGAELVKTGTYSSTSSNPAHSVAVLGYAMDPLEALQRASDEEEVETLLEHMADAVGLASAHAASLSDDEKKYLLLSKEFFDALYSSLIGCLSQGSLSPLKLEAAAIY